MDFQSQNFMKMKKTFFFQVDRLFVVLPSEELSLSKSKSRLNTTVTAEMFSRLSESRSILPGKIYSVLTYQRYRENI